MTTDTERPNASDLANKAEREAAYAAENIGHCDTCLHWQPPAAAWKQDLGDCKRIKHLPGGEACETLACTADYEDYSSYFHCKAEFGCVLWEPAHD